MRRIDVATAVGSPPAVPANGTQGYFTNGSVVGGIPATEVPDWWLNMMQGEVEAVVLAAGLTPSKTNWTQLLAALGGLFGGGGTLAANGWQKLPGGLIVQWGTVARATRTLSASVTVTFPLAFPNACYVVIPSIDYANPGLLDMWPGHDTPTLTQVALIAGIAIGEEGTASRDFGWRWIALGR